MDPAKRTYALAGAWGLAESTLFFIVPDVHLSWVALKSYRRAMIACAWATTAALLGGAIIWWLGATRPDSVRAVFDWIPAIGPAMIDDVANQLDSRGINALFIGPLIGTPYKIYALEAAAAGFGMPVFLLVSIPARMMRFVVVTSIAALAGRYLQRVLSIRVLERVLCFLLFSHTLLTAALAGLQRCQSMPCAGRPHSTSSLQTIVSTTSCQSKCLTRSIIVLLPPRRSRPST